jgi:phosphoglycolate phosphatase-like HAD superfamily hydrolase
VGKRPSPRLFIFDLDGTLVQFAIDWVEVKRRLRQLLSTDESLTPLIPTIDGLPVDSDLKTRAYQLIDAVELGRAQGFGKDDGLVHLFRHLKSDGRRVALITLQGRAAAEEALKRLGVREFVDLVVSRDEHRTRKAQIAQSLTILGVSASHSVVIADRQADMVAARELGCLTIAVGGRAGVSGDLTAAKAADVLEVLGMEDG